ncbi:hypothetical protein BRC85_11160 [Halobacteriales archaeon QS_1_69_70]|nr:MAG: hypothetical protein BRC85_11160 [Halobacteriales archaeon QS_1_69_70]
MTGTVVLVAVAAVEPVLFVVAVPLAAATGAFWYRSSGRLRERAARAGARTQGAGRDPGRGGGFSTRARREAGRHRNRRQRERRDRAGRASGATSDVSRVEAYRRLGLEPTADEAAVRAAYRRAVKDVHPDRGGDEAEFRRVTEAYERLVE